MIEALSEEKQYRYLSTLTHYADMADRRAQSNEYEALVLRGKSLSFTWLGRAST